MSEDTTLARLIASRMLPFAGVDLTNTLSDAIEAAIQYARAEERERMEHQNGYLVRGTNNG